MVMLKPNVTNWVMIHQQDFNFQVLKKVQPFSARSMSSKVFNSLTIPTTDFYLSFEFDDNPWLKRANLKVVSIKVSLNICYCHETTS